MKVGTKSLLFGVHQIFIHPICVALAWRKLYGFPWDPRLWVAFIVHDWGYWGLSEMDGPEGDKHPEVGANIIHKLFDGDADLTWYYFAMCHSRFLAKTLGYPPSKLCMADKLAVSYYPTRLFVFLATLSGEIKFFMDEASQKKHATMGLNYSTPYTFVNTMKANLWKYAFNHKDGQKDIVT